MLVLVVLFIGFLLHPGSESTGNPVFQHKYDSLQQVTNKLTMVLSQTSSERDSARRKNARLKHRYDSISKARDRRAEVYKSESEKYRKLYLSMTDDELSREAERIYNEAHPIPLFDGAMEPVGVGKGPLVHLFEQNNKAQFLEVENHDLSEQLKIKNIENASKDFMISRYQTDSTAHVGLIQTHEYTIATKNEEIDDLKKQHKKELRRERRQKVIATGLAILATTAAIIF